MKEIYATIRGFKSFHASSEEPMDKNELEKLMELYPD
tara:strand:- start:24 stop:134 length:111 start_codon:yes stop_codon:yes gene_type:complete